MNHRLTGEYECKLDSKGRIKLPAGLVRQLSPSGAINFTINRGLERCLTMWTSEVWKEKSEEVNQLNYYNQKERQFQRYFYRGATTISTDSIDRVNIPNSLTEWAGLNKDVVLFAISDRIEIWAKDKYHQVLEDEPEEFSVLAEEIFGEKKQADINNQHEVS